MRGEADWVTGKLPPRLCWNLRDRGDEGGLLEVSTCSTREVQVSFCALGQCLVLLCASSYLFLCVTTLLW